MKFSFASLLAFVSVATLSNTAPVHKLLKRADPTEIQVLNYALTLEHLESAFYAQYLSQFSASDFSDAGFPDYVRGRINQIAEHEAEHVKFLQTALGSGATQACKYTFPVKTVKDFVTVSQVLEGVGVTAYLGAAQFLHTPAYLTAAGSILTTEARHNAWVNSVGLQSYPWSGSFDTPQTLDQVYSLAAPFIVPNSCPSSNPTLPVKAFPALTANQTANSTTITLKYDGSESASGQFLVLLSGLDITPVAINGGKADVPEDLQGTVYAIVSKDKTANDNSTVTGPAILTFPFSAFADQ